YPAAVTGLDGRIYAIGGITDSSSTQLNSAEVYDPATNRWTPIAPMPTARFDHAAVTGPDGRIYVLGGEGGGAIQKAAEVYDPRTDIWSSLPPLLYGHSNLTAAMGPGGLVYAVGGNVFDDTGQ